MYSGQVLFLKALSECVKTHQSEMKYFRNSVTSFIYNHPSMYLKNWLINVQNCKEIKSHNHSWRSKCWWFAISSLLIHRLAGAKSQYLWVERQVNHLVINAQSSTAAKEDLLWLNQWINHRINIFNWLITTCSTGDLQWSLHWSVLKNRPCPFNPHASFAKDWIVIGFRWTSRVSGMHQRFWFFCL